jgi:hypothetical protein
MKRLIFLDLELNLVVSNCASDVHLTYALSFPHDERGSKRTTTNVFAADYDIPAKCLHFKHVPFMRTNIWELGVAMKFQFSEKD